MEAHSEQTDHPKITKRPGGRSSRIRESVLNAVAQLRNRQEDLTIPALAVESGVSAAAIYRRWGDVGSVFYDFCLQEVERLPAPHLVGDLRLDISAYVSALSSRLNAPGASKYLALLVHHAHHRSDLDLVGLLQRRNRFYRYMLNQAGYEHVPTHYVKTLIVAPLLMWSFVGAPVRASDDLAVIVQNACTVIDSLPRRARTR